MVAVGQLKTPLHSLWIFLSFLVIAFAAEALLQRYRGRRIRAQEHWDAPASR